MLVGSNPEPDPVAERVLASVAIKGEIASPVNVGAGCRFAGRCPKVMDVCRSTTPKLEPVADAPSAHRVACHLYDTAGAQGQAPT